MGHVANMQSHDSAGGIAHTDLRELLRALPKIELHRHLEGSLRLETLAAIGLEHGVDLPSYDMEKLRPYVQITDDPPDFHRFLEKFRFLRRFYSKRESIERVAYEAVADAALDNVKYMELRFNPATLASSQGFLYEEVVQWVIEAVRRAEEDFDIKVRFMCTITRDHDLGTVQRIVDVALAYTPEGVVGLDLAGDEANYNGHPFASYFRQAKRAGLRNSIHAGEVVGPESVWAALDLFEADRIGHGVRSVWDSALVERLRDDGIGLEVCPTSNIQTGAVKSLGHHPLRKLYQEGVPVTVNTDDPSICNTTMTDEYLVAMRAIGVTLDELKQMTLNAARVAFLPPDEKDELVTWFKQALDQHAL